MYLDAIELFRVSMPLNTAWRTAFGEDSTIDGVFVRLLSGDVEGWGGRAPTCFRSIVLNGLTARRP